jgi:hypothetical protein
MKKMLSIMGAGLVLAGIASAAVYEETFTVTTNAVVTSGILPISGTLDKIEVIQASAAVTNSIVVATYSGTTAVDTILTLTDLAGNKVVRPRVIGTTTAGVNLAGVAAGGTNTSAAATTVLVANYEAPYVAGNVKAVLTANAANAAVSSTITLRFYFKRD